MNKMLKLKKSVKVFEMQETVFLYPNFKSYKEEEKIEKRRKESTSFSHIGFYALPRALLHIQDLNQCV